MTSKLNTLALALVLGAVCASARADYPERPIQIVVPFAAGSPPDQLARVLADSFGPSLGTSVVVQNMAGAAGNIGVAHVAKSAADGYTLVLAGDAAIVVNPAIYDRLPFDPQRDLAPVSQVAVTPNVLVVGTQVPATSVSALVALAREQPGQLAFASAGAGTSSHRAGELLQRQAGIALTHVPYKNSALPDVVGGNVTMFFANPATSLPLVRDGKLRALAVSSLRRLSIAPELPTLAESGFRGFEAVAWFGLLAPAGTPPAVLKRLQAETARALAQPAMRDKLAAMGAEPVGSTPEEFVRLIASETPKWAQLMKAAGIKAD